MFHRRKHALNRAEKFADFPGLRRRSALNHIRHALMALAGVGALGAAVAVLNVPAPGAVLCAGMAVASALLGYTGGIFGGVATAVAACYLFSENHSLTAFSAQGLGRLTAVLLSAAVIALTVGRQKRNLDKARQRLTEANATLREDTGSMSDTNTIDPLTGIQNRWAIRRDYARYENHSITVMMLDLDEYQRTNDTYGHAVGDYILKKVGAALSEVFGAGACYRYAGDAFLVICMDLDRAALPARVSRLQEALGDIYLDDKRLPVTFSAGSVHGQCEQSDDLRLMMHQAEYNLLEVKRRGGGHHIDTDYSRKTARSLERLLREE